MNKKEKEIIREVKQIVDDELEEIAKEIEELS